MGTNKDYQKIAKEKNKTITCDMLTDDAVEILHQDGSEFHIRNALLDEVDEDVFIVYAEHFPPMVFWKEDLIEYRKVAI